MKEGTILAIGLMLAPAAVSAEGVPVTPGKWEMTTTIQMPMLPAPQVEKSLECVEETELSPDDFNTDEQNQCTMGDVEIDGDTISWSMECPGPTGNMTGKWTFTSKGDSASGQGSMTADLGGQVMEINMTWTGKRVGDCDQ